MKRRRAIAIFIIGTFLLAASGAIIPELVEKSAPYMSAIRLPFISSENNNPKGPALEALDALEVKGRASKTGYTRDQFGKGWAKTTGCDTRSIILFRDLRDAVLQNECSVLSGTLDDPYTGETIQFSKSNSTAVQIDHVVALSDAWQKGAQALSREQRIQLANDPLELLAVDGPANQAKGDGDAATWLPKNKTFRCQYIARQIAIKTKYHLWVTPAEYMIMKDILSACPSEVLPQ